MMASDQAPKATLHHDRQAHGSLDVNVAQVFDVDRRHASEHRIAQVERAPCRICGFDRHLFVIDIGDQPQWVANIKCARLGGDV